MICEDSNNCNEDYTRHARNSKVTCNSCGTTFVAGNGATLCPSCSANQSDHQHSGCGWGH
jgi:rubrerythrin